MLPMNYNISLGTELSKIVEREMKRRKFSNRSEFFRDLVRRVFVDEEVTIERLSPSDPDYKLAMKRMKRGEKYLTAEQVRRELNLPHV